MMNKRTAHMFHLLLAILMALTGIGMATPALAAISIEDAASSAPALPDSEQEPPTGPTAPMQECCYSGCTRNFGNGLDAGDPISTNAGAYHFDLPLLSLGGPMNLGFTLRYRSDFTQISWSGEIGVPERFWWSPLENVVYFHAPGDTYFSAQISNGDLIAFKWEDGQWVPTDKDYQDYEDNVYPIHWLLRESDDYFYLMDPVGERVHIFYKVDPGNARIARIVDRNGNQLIYSYATPNDLHPARVDDNLGRSLDFTYQDVDGEMALVKVIDQAGRQITLTHEAEGADNDGAWTLRSVTDSMTETTTFAYTAVEDPDWPGIYLINNVASVEHPLGNIPYTQTYTSTVLNGTRNIRVASQQDAYGNTVALAYDPVAYRVTESRPGGITVTHEHYGHHSLPRAYTDPAGNTTQVGRNAETNRPISITNRLSDTLEWAYHETGKLAAYTDTLAHVTTFTYTAQTQTFTNPILITETVVFTFYNMTEVGYPDGGNEQAIYDAHGNPTSFTDRRGYIWNYTYNDQGLMLTRTNPNGGVTTYTYHPDGTLASQTDSDTGVTDYAYDTAKRLTTVTRPDGKTLNLTYNNRDQLVTLTDEQDHTITFTYDANGNLTSRTNALNKTWTFDYDLMDRLVGITDPQSHTISYTYDANGRLASVTDRNDNTTTYLYDDRGLITGRVDQIDQTWSYGYDEEGRVTSLATPLGYTTTVQTDAQGQVIGITNPLDQRMEFTYDDMGRVASLTTPLGRQVANTYGGEGDLVGATKPGLGSATYTRDELGLITRFVDQRGENWDAAYSPMGRLISLADPLGSEWTYNRDDQGRMSQINYPGGGSCVFTYADAGQITQVAYSDGVTTALTFDDVGRVLTANELTLAYDNRGEIISSQDGAESFNASYDDGQRLATVTYGSQAVVTYTYDVRNLLIRAEDDLAGAWIEFQYDDDRRLIGINRSNDVTTTLTHNAASRITRIQDGDLADQQLTLNADGDPIQAAMSLPLDPADYLLVGATNLTYDAANQIGSPGYTYDNLGRQISAPGKTFTYDLAGRLTSITGASDTAAFTYDGFNNLRTRTVDGAVTTYYHNYALGMTPIVAEKEGATYRRFYVYTPEGALLYSIDAADGAVRFYHFDRIGSTFFLTDADGAVSDAYAYDPYGALLAHTGPSDQPFTFIGRFGVRWEPVGGIYDMRARYYDPDSQRFLSRDPVWGVPGLLESLNPYLYAAANPIRYNDPLGLDFRITLPGGDPLPPSWGPLGPSPSYLPPDLDLLARLGVPIRYPGGWNTPSWNPGVNQQPYNGPSLGAHLENGADWTAATLDRTGQYLTALEYGSKGLSALGQTDLATKGLTQLGQITHLGQYVNGSKVLGALNTVSDYAGKIGTGLTVVQGNIEFVRQAYQISQGAAYHYGKNKGSPGARTMDLLFYNNNEQNGRQVYQDYNQPWYTTERIGSELGAGAYHVGHAVYSAGEATYEAAAGALSTLGGWLGLR